MQITKTLCQIYSHGSQKYSIIRCCTQISHHEIFTIEYIDFDFVREFPMRHAMEDFPFSFRSQKTKEQDHENNCRCSLQHDKHVQLCRLSIVLFSVDRKYRHNVVSCTWVKKELLRNIKSRVHGGERALNINALFGSLQQRMLEELQLRKKKTFLWTKNHYL